MHHRVPLRADVGVEPIIHPLDHPKEIDEIHAPPEVRLAHQAAGAALDQLLVPDRNGPRIRVAHDTYGCVARSRHPCRAPDLGGTVRPARVKLLSLEQRCLYRGVAAFSVQQEGRALGVVRHVVPPHQIGPASMPSDCH